jgi:hypothetical protein
LARRHLPETNAAKAKIAHETALAAATETAPHDAGTVFRFLFAARNDGFFLLFFP